MDFGFNDEQEEIKRTAREMLAARCSMARVREAVEGEGRYLDELWTEICELGWPGIAISEENGGQGLGTVELAILCEELGYACAPVPYLSNAIAGLLVEDAGSDEQRERWLEGIATGEARGAAAVSREDSPLVLDPDGAAVLLMPEGQGESGKLVEPGDAEISPLELIDSTRSHARVSATGGDQLAGGPQHAINRAMVAVAAELVGVSQRALEMAVDYAKEREQFGRPIGAYQAVSHRCAEMLWDVEESRSLTLYAAWTADAEPESLSSAASMAKARASDSAWSVTASALQVFGGIGFTWEHDLQFLLKRARVAGGFLGSARTHRDRVAALAGLG